MLWIWFLYCLYFMYIGILHYFTPERTFLKDFPLNVPSNWTSYTRIVCHWLYRSFLVITQCVKLDPVYATSISTLKPRKRNYFVMSWMTSKEILGHFLPNYNTQTQWFPYVKMGNMWEWEILLTLVTCLCMRGVKFQVYRYIINRVFLWQRFPSCSCYHINSISYSWLMFISHF